MLSEEYRKKQLPKAVNLKYEEVDPELLAAMDAIDEEDWENDSQNEEGYIPDDFIQQAIENPEVTVLVSASNLDALDTFFGPMLGLYRLVELDYPNDEERKDIWRHAQAEHPSMRGLDVSKLVPFSKGMSRFELYAVVTESVEDAYRRRIASAQCGPTMCTCVFPISMSLIRQSIRPSKRPS